MTIIRNMPLTVILSGDCEATAAPWWVIIDPARMLSPSASCVGSMLRGPFFSKAEAELALQKRSYAFSRRARVYCLAGYDGSQYYQQYQKLYWKYTDPS